MIPVRFKDVEAELLAKCVAKIERGTASRLVRLAVYQFAKRELPKEKKLLEQVARLQGDTWQRYCRGE